MLLKVNRMFIEKFGKMCRVLPFFRGKNFLARKIIFPFIRRSGGHVCIVDMDTPGGGKLICNLEDWIPWNVYLHGKYQIEKNYEAFMMNKAKDASVIFDVGANIGYYTIQFSNISRGNVFAFEPMSYQHDTLRKNIEINGHKNIHVMKCVVSDENRHQRVYFSGVHNTGSSSVEVETDEHEDVDAITLDDFIREEKLHSIDLIKIDVEGHELHVLKGMKDTLSQGRVKHLFMEINKKALSAGNTTPMEICSYLDGFGYFPHSIRTGKMEDYKIGADESLVYFSRNS